MARSSTVGILRVLLSANTAEFDAAMAAAARTAKGLTKDFADAGRQLSNVGATLTKALTVPLVGLAATSVKAAISFESSFAGIRKTVDGVVDSTGELTAAGKEIQQAMRDLAKSIPVTVDELNAIGETAGALGIPRDKIVDFTKVMAELGVTTNLTSEEAANSIARIQNIFGAAGKDTDRLASTLVALGNAGASTEKEIVEMSQRIAGAGHTVGLTQAQVLAFASTLASVGINAEAGGSAISRIFLKMNDAVSKGGAGLKEFARVANLSATDFKAAFEKDAAGATTAFINGLGRLKATGENINSTIEGLVGKNIILKDTLFRVAGAGTLLTDQLRLADTAWRENTALTKEAEQRFKTTEAQLALLWNRIKDVGITIGNALKPAIDTAIAGVSKLLPIVDGLATAFAALPGPIQLGALGIAGIAAAAGPTIWAFGQMAQGAATVTALFTKKGLAARGLAAALGDASAAAAVGAESTGLLAGAVGLLTNPITLTIAGLALLGGGIYAVATAETDLERSLKANGAAFRDHTQALENALRTYRDLKDQQRLTKDESAALDAATRLLAEASGLSVDAFRRETSQSEALTTELGKQLEKRKELHQQAVNQSREQAVSAFEELGRARAELDRLKSGQAQKIDVVGLGGKVDTQTRAFTTEERAAEVARLSKVIAELTVKANAATKAFTELAGPLANESNDPAERWVETSRALAGVTGAAKEAGASVSVLAQLNATYAADMKKIGANGFKEIQQAHEKYGVAVKELAEKYGVATSSIDRWIGSQKAATKETKEANAELTAFTKKADQLEGDLQRAASAGVPMATVLEEFGSQIKDVTNKAPLFGKAVGEATKAAADALKSSDLSKAAAKLIEQLNDQARGMVEKWKKAGEDSARAAAEALAKGNAKFLADASALQRGLISLDDDSLQKRQKLIRLEYDDKRAALDKFGTFYADQLDLLNAQEAKALRESGQTWDREQRQKVTSSLEALGQSFAQLAQVSGGSFSAVARDIGSTLASMALARKAVDGLRDSFKEIKGAFAGGDFDFSGFTKGLANAVGSALAAGAALWQATDPRGKSATGTAISGAMAGQAIGEATNIPGASFVGLGVGALIGWWRSKHAEWRKVAKQIGNDIGEDISQGVAQKIADLEATIEGGTKNQRRDWAIAISLPDVIADRGGLNAKNLQTYENQARDLFEVIKRGGAAGAQATETLNTLIGQFGGQAEKTGGMWDPVFKNLIAQSKALGINIDAITEAVDKQIGKLSGGLGAAVKGAFAGTDDKLSAIVKGLAKDEAAALDDAFKHAQEKGFQGTIQDYFVQQAKLYRTSKEGDPALGTFFSGDTLKKFESLSADSQSAFDRLSRTAMASFNAIVASGKSAFEAIGQIGPVVDQLIAQHDKLGLSGGAAYEQLARFRNLTKDNEDLVASVGGLNDTLTALANLGGLNADVLADLEAQGLDTFAKLQAAGFTENEALQQMVPFLENVLKAHKDLGIPIDENTQKLIDQAEAQGLLSEEALSTNDLLLEGFKALIEAVGGKVPEAFNKMAKAAKTAGKDAKDAIDGIPRDVEVKVRTKNEGGYDGSGINPYPGTVRNEDVDPRQFARGGVVPTQYANGGATIGRLLNFSPRGTDTQPAMLTPGEGVLNLDAMRRIGGSAAVNALNSGWRTPIPTPPPQAAPNQIGNLTLNLSLAGAQFADENDAASKGRALGRAFLEEVRRGGAIRTQFGDEVKSVMGGR